MTSVRRLLLRVATVLLLVVLLVFTYQAVRTVLALRQAVNAAHSLSADVRRNDVDAVTETLRTVEDRSDTARAHSDNFLWDAAARLPFLGDDIEAVQVMSRSLADASDAASAPAISLLTQVQDENLRDREGRLNLAVISDLAPSLEALTTALQGAADDVGALDPDGLVGPLADVTTNVQEEFDSLLSTAQAGETLVRVLPPMLGESGPRAVPPGRAEQRRDQVDRRPPRLAVDPQGRRRKADPRGAALRRRLRRAVPARASPDQGGAGAVRRQPRREHPRHEPDARLPTGRSADARALQAQLRDRGRRRHRRGPGRAGLGAQGHRAGQGRR